MKTINKNIKKTLDSVALNISESEYRSDKALSYSLISRYSNEGFHNLDKLFDKITTPSLVGGSVVDTLITGTIEEFNENFLVSDINIDSDTAAVMQAIYNECKDTYKDFMQIPIITVSQLAKQNGFWPNDKWADQARYNGLLKKGDLAGYYAFLVKSEGKTVITKEQYEDSVKCVQMLKTADATKFYFADNVPNDPIQRYYQLKFKASFNDVDYRCMADLIIVDYANKKIYPVDLKTSSTPEDEFYFSFVKWHYQIQARLYYRIIEDNLKKDDYFKDFEIDDYTFIVINKRTLIPLTWKFKDTKSYGKLTYGKRNSIVFPDPFYLGEELNYYLTHPELTVPKGINLDKTNDIVDYLNKLN